MARSSSTKQRGSLSGRFIVPRNYGNVKSYDVKKWIIESINMIKYANDEKLRKRGLNEKYDLFYQIWKELTYDKTMKSYQFRVMNTLSAINELINVIQQRFDNKFNNNFSIDECKAETCSIIKEDHVLSKYYPSVKNRLLKHLNEKTETIAQLKRLVYCLHNYCDQIQNDYLKHLFNCLEEDIDNNDRKSIVRDADAFISNCVSDGWSPRALFDIVDTLFDRENEWEKFRSKFPELNSNYVQSYIVFIPLKVKLISKKADDDKPLQRVVKTIEEMSFEIKTYEKAKKEYSDIEFLKTDYFLLLPIAARDFYSAAHEAINKYSDILNLLSFFNVIEPWNIQQIQVISYNDTSHQFKLIKSGDLYSAYDYMESASKHFRDAISIHNDDGSSLASRLSATYSYGNMGKASYTQEEKFITTWVALESLCRTDVYENIISNVLETVPPALCRRYIFKLVRNFYEDCIRCNVKFDEELSEIVVRDSRKQTTFNLIEALNNPDKYAVLLDKCKVNSLLSYRCEEMHELLTDPNKIFARVTRHYNNVRRQLSRLYRKRNEIAHSASNNIYMMRYIEHLDDYLSSFVSEVVMCANERNLDNIEQILELIKDNYQEFKEAVSVSGKKGNVSPELDKFLKTGVIELV